MKNKMTKEEVARLRPAARGSITEVRKPCINKNCAARGRGEKHAATILTYWEGKKHRCMYVPKAPVSELKLALRNGRKLEKMMKEMGPHMIYEYRKNLNAGK